MDFAPAQWIVVLLFGPRTDVAGPSFTELDGSTFSAARIVDLMDATAIAVAGTFAMQPAMQPLAALAGMHARVLVTLTATAQSAGGGIMQLPPPVCVRP